MEVSCWDEDVGANESLAKIRAQSGGGAAGLAFANKSTPPLRRAPLQKTCLCNRRICSKRLEIQHRALRDFPGEGLRRESELRFIESWVSTYFVIGAREIIFCNATALHRRRTCCPRSNFVCRRLRNHRRIHEGKSKFTRGPGNRSPRPRAVATDGFLLHDGYPVWWQNPNPVRKTSNRDLKHLIRSSFEEYRQFNKDLSESPSFRPHPLCWGYGEGGRSASMWAGQGSSIAPRSGWPVIM